MSECPPPPPPPPCKRAKIHKFNFYGMHTSTICHNGVWRQRSQQSKTNAKLCSVSCVIVSRSCSYVAYPYGLLLNQTQNKWCSFLTQKKVESKISGIMPGKVAAAVAIGIPAAVLVGLKLRYPTICEDIYLIREYMVMGLFKAMKEYLDRNRTVIDTFEEQTRIIPNKPFIFF